LNVSLYGTFALETDDGRDLTPPGRKPAALIALLAETASMKRTRRWIEQTLWSDRGERQARGSLRQTLLDLRRHLGPEADILGSDRTAVWLDGDRVRVRRATAGRAFLEGFDAPDPEFRDWLTRKRLAHGRPMSIEAGIERTVRIQCGLPWTAALSDPIGARIVNERVGNIVSGFIAHSTRGVLNSDVDLIVQASLEERGGTAIVAVEVVDAKRDVLIHSDHCVVDDLARFLGDSAELGRFCWMVADTALDLLAEQRRNSDAAALRAAWSQEAIRAVLTFDHEKMPRSLDILDVASGQLEDGLFHALRGWATMSLMMEGRLEETRDSRAAVRDMLAKAQNLAPGDPVINGFIANVSAILFDDFDTALKTASASLRGQPNNIFATQAMSLARFRSGAHEDAYALSRLNRNVAEATKYAAMCNLHHALLCLRTRRGDEAIVVARAAATAVPSYRAPNRQLIALYAAAGKVEAAVEQAALLGKTEPGFTMDRFFDDDSYPTNTLRETGTLDLAKRRYRGGA
jgi:hypothetical protein